MRRWIPWMGFLLLVLPSYAEETLDYDTLTQIREEGFKRSEVMDILSHLTDEIGPRLTASPASTESHEWTRDQLKEWGLENAHLQAYEFGHGWSFDRASVHVISPRPMPVSALPMAWTVGTEGPVRGMAMKLKLESEEDLDEHQGTLAGKILFLDDAAEFKFGGEVFKRLDEADLEDKKEFGIRLGERGSRWKAKYKKKVGFYERLNEYLAEEGVVAVVEVSSRPNGVIRVGGGGTNGKPERHPGVPEVTMAQEHYNWILRQLDREVEVELEIDIQSRFHDGPQAYNTLAEIPGTDKNPEVVLLGGHLDSWHTGTGATDNGAGCAVMMEAMRILKAIGVKPKRTIRIGLWSGEEQGLHGSKAYVEEYLATRPESEDEEQKALPKWLRDETWPIQLKKGHARHSAYFNVDNGAGKIRGIYAENNMAAAEIFKDWLEPLHDLGADTVTLNGTGGTDHQSFQRVGLPGYQFIQDPMEYFYRTHHTEIDTLDHVVPEDLAQAAVVVASFAYEAAMRPARMPRKPMPVEPKKKKKKKVEAKAEATTQP